MAALVMANVDFDGEGTFNAMENDAMDEILKTFRAAPEIN